jgi:hypothetical protein
MSAARKNRNLAASIRQRLLDLARERGEDFQTILDRYAVMQLVLDTVRSMAIAA